MSAPKNPAIAVRNASLADLPGIMAVEEEWPEDQRAGRDKFESRLNRFGDGVFVAEVDGGIVGVCTSCLARYSDEDLSSLSRWEHVTNDGYLHAEPPEGANALYIVSNGILTAHRRTGVRQALLGCQLELTRRLALPFAFTGAMIPGYDRYCRENGEVSAAEYARIEVDGVPVDPTIRTLGKLGFELPDARHIIANYYQSPESRDYGALLVYRSESEVAAARSGDS